MGKHAKTLNSLLKIQEKLALYQEKEDLGDSKPGMATINLKTLAPLLSLSEKSTSYTSSDSKSYTANQQGSSSSKLDPIRNLTVDGEEPSEKNHIEDRSLSESVGHTEIQVIVGALLGFLISLATEFIL